MLAKSRFLRSIGAILLAACLPALSFGATFHMSGDIIAVSNNLNGSGVDLTGIVEVGDPFEVIYSINPATPDGNGLATRGFYTHAVGGGNFYQGTAGNFSYESTNAYKVIIYNDDAIFDDSYSADVNSPDVFGMTGNFPAGTFPDFAETHVTLRDNVAPLDLIPAASGDTLTGPPDLSLADPVLSGLRFGFRNSDGVLLAQFFGDVLSAGVVVPEPSACVLVGLALSAVFMTRMNRSMPM